jgi:hypothetical protein
MNAIAQPLVDELLPVYDVSDTVATTVHASAAATWDALMQVDLLEVGRRKPLVGLLSAVRVLPEMIADLMRGGPRRPGPTRLRLRDLTELPMGQGGWVLLGERPGTEIALGLVGKFWLPVITYRDVPANAFTQFDEPGFAKTIYGLSIRPIDGERSLLTGTMRTATTDESAHKWFQRYWALGVGSGAHLVANGLLEMTRETAEEINPSPDEERPS